MEALTPWEEIVAIIQTECGEYAREAIEQITLHCGGCQVYVPRRKPPQVHHTDTPQTLMRKHGVSRRTAYNWINRFRR